MRSRVMIWKQMNGCSYPGFSDRQHCFPILVQFFVFGLVLVEILLWSGSRWKWPYSSRHRTPNKGLRKSTAVVPPSHY
ncbi:unnamed protein product [Victoria cruziana]